MGVSEQELKQIIDDIEAVTRENLADLKKARQMLEEEGLITPSGDLTEFYR